MKDGLAAIKDASIALNEGSGAIKDGSAAKKGAFAGRKGRFGGFLGQSTPLAASRQPQRGRSSSVAQGGSPGSTGTKNHQSPNGATPPDALVPDVSLIPLKAVLRQQLPKLLLERDHLVMLLLTGHILLQVT
jgi:hypothetical protein